MAPDPGSRRAGFVGVIPGRVGIVAERLDAGLLQRWDRWFELASARGLPARLDPRRPCWRLAVAPGVFGAPPLFGAMRLGQDALGRTYPVAVLAQGDPPEAAAPWFDAAAATVAAATSGASLDAVAARVHGLPPPGPGVPGAVPSGAAAVLWRDDWQVHEHRCATPADLAAFPLALAAEAAPDEEAA